MNGKIIINVTLKNQNDNYFEIFFLYNKYNETKRVINNLWNS